MRLDNFSLLEIANYWKMIQPSGHTGETFYTQLSTCQENLFNILEKEGRTGAVWPD